MILKDDFKNVQWGGLSTFYPSMYTFSAKHSLYLERSVRVLDFNPYFVVVTVRKPDFFWQVLFLEVLGCLLKHRTDTTHTVPLQQEYEGNIL